MQYDFNMAAFGGQQLDVKGKFFKYKSGNGLIRVKATGGGYVDLLPGQGVWNVEYSGINIADRSGLPNAGVLLAGEFDFHDDRITGTVDVVDGGKSRSLQGVAFASAVLGQPLGGTRTTCQLWNPPGSAKKVIVSKLFLSSTITGIINIGTNNVVNAGGPGGVPASKKASGSAPVARHFPDGVAGVPLGFQYLGQVILTANQPFIYQLAEPVLLDPGYGFCTWHNTADTPQLSTTFEFIEEAI
jgi:hypothetical protein